MKQNKQDNELAQLLIWFVILIVWTVMAGLIAYVFDWLPRY